jgi:NTE family protein
MTKTYTALVLQGGGSLGAYEFGVIKALYQRPHFAPALIAGVSIGAVAAAILAGARGEPLASLQDFWDSIATPKFPLVPRQLQWLASMPFNAHMYAPSLGLLFNPLRSTSFCNVNALYKTLERLVDLDKLNSPTAPHVVITATNVAPGQIEEFDNREMTIRYEHIVASGSLPPFFPMTTIGDKAYWDGAIVSNTPLRPAVNRLEHMGAGENDVERELVLVELFSQGGKIPRSLPEVFSRMTQMLFASKVRFDEKQYDNYKAFIELTNQINAELPADSPVRQSRGYQRLMQHTLIHKLTVVSNSHPTGLGSGTDFTRKRLQHLIEHGYADACAQLTCLQAARADAHTS